MKLSVSILNSLDRIKSVKELNFTNADYLHIDVMDGRFVHNKAFTFDEIYRIETNSKKKLDVHLMVENPLSYIKKLGLLDIDYVTFHVEIKKNINKIISEIKNMGFRVGMSIKPDTNIEKLKPYLNELDLILIMSVEPGSGGQEFMPSALEKAKELKKIINKNTIIEMDGGINETNIDSIVASGVDMVVVGSYIIKSNDYQEKINTIKK